MSSIKIECVDLHFPGCVLQVSRSFSSHARSKESLCLFHEHSYYEFHFSPYASYDITTREASFPLETDTLFIIPPQLPHYSTCTGADRSIILNVALEQLDGDPAFYDHFKKSMDTNCLRPIKVSDDIKTCFYRFDNISDNDTVKKHCTFMLSALAILSSLLTEDDSVTHKGKQEQFDILLENYVNAPSYSLSQIAENLNYSQRQTARLIRKKYNMPLGDIRRLQTLSTFKKLIDDGYSIREAMTLSEIKNPEAFRRFFKKHEGISPRDYKSMWMKKAKNEKGENDNA